MHATRRVLRQYEATSLEPFRKQAQSIARPPQQLYQITASATKHEYVTREGVLRQRGLHHGGQSVHTAAHIGHTRSEPYMCARRQCNHARCARQSSTTPSARASTAP